MMAAMMLWSALLPTAIAFDQTSPGRVRLARGVLFAYLAVWTAFGGVAFVLYTG